MAWKPKHGDTGWEVEWCVEIPLTPEGDGDLDNARYKRRDFRTEKEADAFAREVYLQDAFGAVAITPFTIEAIEESCPAYGLQRVYTGESKHFEGVDEPC